MNIENQNHHLNAWRVDASSPFSSLSKNLPQRSRIDSMIKDNDPKDKETSGTISPDG